MTRSAVTRIRSRITGFVNGHIVAWELTMGLLAIFYVVLGVLIDEGGAPSSFSTLETSLTAIFVAEFSVRFWAAPDRWRYLRGHFLDLVALLPAVRALRALRLLRLVRLLRLAPSLYRATGLDLPIVRRLNWHLDRLRDHVDRRLATVVMLVIAAFVGTAALFVTVLEKPWTLQALGESFYWATNTVLGSGDTSYVGSPTGWLMSWLLIVLGLTLLAIATGTLVSILVDFALKEGRGMGAAGYRDHIVVCGWNTSARDLIEELKGDEYSTRIVLVCDAERNPAGDGIYFVHGDPTDPGDLERAGIREAAAAIVFPNDGTDEADMRSILTILAIESLAPRVRTIVAVNNSRHVEHFRRAHADEVMVPSQIAAHLAARTALYPGLTELVSDIVSGGEGAELYRIVLPKLYEGTSVDDLAGRLLREHRATLMAISRRGESIVNPAPDFTIEPGDEALIVAESTSSLRPLEVSRATPEAASS